MSPSAKRRVALAFLSLALPAALRAMFAPLLVLSLSCVALLILPFPSIPKILLILAVGVALGAFVFAVALAAPKLQALYAHRVLRNIERQNNIPHRPLTSSPRIDPLHAHSVPLWLKHRAALRNSLNLVSSSPTLKPLAAPLLLLAPLALLLAFPQHAQQQLSSLSAAAFPVPPPPRIVAWALPPDYLQKPPVPIPITQNNSPVNLPQHSVLHLQVHASRALVSLNSLKPSPLTQKGDNLLVWSHTLNADASFNLLIPRGSHSFRLNLHAVPDQPPVASFPEKPLATPSNTLLIPYLAKDDHAVSSAALVVSLNETPKVGRLLPLAPPPRIDVPLPKKSTKSIQGLLAQNLEDHPWAGQKVTLLLHVSDSAVQLASSKPHSLTLPSRSFKTPLARAIDALRTPLLLIGSDAAQNVVQKLDFLVFNQHPASPQPPAPPPHPAVIIALAAAQSQLLANPSYNDVLHVAKLLRNAAKFADDGALHLALQQLRDALKNLQNSLNNNPTPDALASLLQQLRDALNNAQNAANQRQTPPPPNSQSVSLNNLLRSLENALQTGDLKTAQRLLEELSQLAENLASPQNPNAAKNFQTLLSAIQKQQQLADQLQQSLANSNKNNPNNQRLQQLAPQQEQIGQSLQPLQSLQDAQNAQNAMMKAADALRNNNPNYAAAQQNIALKSLKKLLNDAQNQSSRSQQIGGPSFFNQHQHQLDPGANRAREIRRLLQNRANNQRLPELERDYLKRLLKLF